MPCRKGNLALGAAARRSCFVDFFASISSRHLCVSFRFAFRSFVIDVYCVLRILAVTFSFA